MILKRDDRPNPVPGGTGAYGVKVEAARPQKNTRWLLFSNDQRVRVQPNGRDVSGDDHIPELEQKLRPFGSSPARVIEIRISMSWVNIIHDW